MKKVLCLFIFLLCAAFCCRAEGPVAIQIPEIILPLKDKPVEFSVTFPAVPVKKGFVPVLKGRFYYKYPRFAGVNNNTKIFLNGKELKNILPGGARRLLYRGKAFVYATSKRPRPWYANGGWLFYLCDGEKTSKRILEPKDEKCWYCFDVSDLIRSGRENTFAVKTKHVQKKNQPAVSFMVMEPEVIYLPVHVVKRAAK